eukprot:156684_1
MSSQSQSQAIPPGWIPWMKLQSIFIKMGFVIAWNQMNTIKNTYNAYKTCDGPHDISGFFFDWHCGTVAQREYIANNYLLINRVRFSRAAPANFPTKHRCIDSEWLSISHKK